MTIGLAFVTALHDSKLFAGSAPLSLNIDRHRHDQDPHIGNRTYEETSCKNIAVLLRLTGAQLARMPRFAFAEGEVAGRRAHRAHRLHRRGRLGALLRAATTPRRCGMRSSTPGGPTASSRPVSARATRCGSRRRCRSTDTSSASDVTPFEARLGWVVRMDEGRLRRPRRARSRHRRARSAPLPGRHRAHRARRAARRLPRAAATVSARRRSDQRHQVSHAWQGHCPRLCGACRERVWQRRSRWRFAAGR